jgi:hypothetical protein
MNVALHTQKDHDTNLEETLHFRQSLSFVMTRNWDLAAMQKRIDVLEAEILQGRRGFISAKDPQIKTVFHKGNLVRMIEQKELQKQIREEGKEELFSRLYFSSNEKTRKGSLECRCKVETSGKLFDPTGKKRFS